MSRVAWRWNLHFPSGDMTNRAFGNLSIKRNSIGEGSILDHFSSIDLIHNYPNENLPREGRHLFAGVVNEFSSSERLFLEAHLLPSCPRRRLVFIRRAVLRWTYRSRCITTKK